MADSPSNYLNAQNIDFSIPEGSKPAFNQESVTPGTLGTEVGTIGGLDGVTSGSDSSGTDLTKKQAASTDGGCGTSFTTATEKADISVSHYVNGNVVEVKTVNRETGDTQVKLIKSDGSSFTMAEDGSIIHTTAKREGDPKTGRYDVSAAGQMRFKIGENFLIEVGNKSEVNASEKGGDTKTAKAMSIVVYGNVDIQCVGGDLSAKAKNISLNAENELKLYAGAKIGITTGAGKAGDKGTDTQEAKVEYGGAIEILTGDINTQATTIRQSGSVNTTAVEGEANTAVTNTLGAAGISGQFIEISAPGDMTERIGGKKLTSILGTTNPLGSLKDQISAYQIDLTSAGFGVECALGDVSIATQKGSVILATDVGDATIKALTGAIMVEGIAGGFAAVDADKKGTNGKPLGLVPGVYVKGYNAKDVYAFTSGSLKIGIGDVTKGIVSNGITIAKEKLEIKNSTGIYLN